MRKELVILLTRDVGTIHASLLLLLLQRRSCERKKKQSPCDVTMGTDGSPWLKTAPPTRCWPLVFVSFQRCDRSNKHHFTQTQKNSDFFSGMLRPGYLYRFLNDSSCSSAPLESAMKIKT